MLDHPKFRLLCIKLKRTAPHLEGYDIVNAIKILSFLGVETNSEIFLVMLNLVRHHINTITLEQVTFLDNIISRINGVPVVDALRMALPMVFQLRIANEMDIENLPQLINHLGFISNHIDVMDERTINSMVTAIMLHMDEISADHAKNIVWRMSRWTSFNQHHQKLLAFCIDRLASNMNEFRTNDIQLLVTRLTIKCVDNSQDFYSERFFMQATEELIRREITFENAVDMLRDFLRIVSEK